MVGIKCSGSTHVFFRIISHRSKSIQLELPDKNNNKIPNEVFIKDLKLCLLGF